MLLVKRNTVMLGKEFAVLWQSTNIEVAAVIEATLKQR
jgi:hypothetical protein